VVRFYGDKSKADAVYKGVEPLTPDDIAEVVVFAAGRKENVVLADSLIFPNHQVSVSGSMGLQIGLRQQGRAAYCYVEICGDMRNISMCVDCHG
jgi:hypothetical protein